MSYIVFCTFDLRNASSQDYENAYSALGRLGLNRVIAADNGRQVVIPTTSVQGSFNGRDAATVRDDLRNRIQQAFTNLGLRSEIYLITGGENWAWGSTTS
ncbi:hypothetical protein [Photobacterium damselae]|uniref:hypothetical protein n=1 Tax=Photobacterium damselae TaxID=38293 RepID=UPI000D92774D|nr:hypothetical protein [Photobacterium damselae]NVO73210.1 hypothetical protein [Photobacterium damselae subsp. damselae]SPY31585.1 Uncharacterised protein [Photobacterium damselae]